MIKSKFYIYRNLHNNSFSVKKDGIVKFRPKIIALYGFIKFNVSELGRIKVLEEKRKNVHATISFSSYKNYSSIKELFGSENINQFSLIEIEYNPYEMEYFRRKDNKEKIFFYNSRVFCFKNKVFILKEDFEEFNKE